MRWTVVSGHYDPVLRGNSMVGAQGAFYFPNTAGSGDSEEDEVEGVYVYPD